MVMTKIHIQFTLFSAFYSPLISTMTGGFLREEGLEYEWSVAPEGKSVIDVDGSFRPCGPDSTQPVLWAAEQG